MMTGFLWKVLMILEKLKFPENIITDGPLCFIDISALILAKGLIFPKIRPSMTTSEEGLIRPNIH